MESWQDGTNADRYAEDFLINENTVVSSDKLYIHLAPGGGFAAVLRPE
jgi:hypothetical protein